MNLNTIIQIIIVVVFIILIYYFVHIAKNEASYVKSDLNGKEYLVQNLDNKDEASYILSVIHERIFILSDYLCQNKNKYPDFRPYIQQFCDRVNDIVLEENAPDGKYTSYTVNKGDKISLCLRSIQTKNLHDLNLIMYVVIHELAHVACPEIDHTELFKKILIFLLEISIMLKIYKYTNYQKHPMEYCGLTIHENLLGH